MPKYIDNPTELVLEHAKKILSEGGYNNFCIRNVAKSCGISVGTIYNYFPTKNELILALIQSHWRQFYQFVEVTDREEIDLFRKLELIYYQLQALTNYFKEIWLKSVEQGIPWNSQETCNRKAAFFNKLRQRLEQIIVNYNETSSRNKAGDITPKELSQFIIGNFIAMAVTQSAYIDYQSFEKILKKLIEHE